MKPLVATVAVLVALATGAPVQAPELDELRALAEQGDADAQFNLGVMYANGRGVPEDDTEAVRWYRLAADQGNAAAQVNLGIRYDIGEGVPQDYAEAVRWYRLAANQRHARAQLNLGVKYRNGEGTPQDYVQAHMWFNLAASRLTGEARETAVQGRDVAEGRMNPDGLNEAQRLAREWNAAHPRDSPPSPLNRPPRRARLETL